MKATITPRPPQSSALQVYQRLAAALIDDAAKELPRPQAFELISLIETRARRLYDLERVPA